MRARDVMTKNLIMVEASVTVAEAIKRMTEAKVSSLIINRQDYDDAYGIVTRRDIVNKIVATGRNPEEIKVTEIMTKPLVIATPNLDVKYLARLMAQTGVRRVPIFDGHQLIGLVSNSDIFRGFGHDLIEKIEKREE